MNINTIVYYCFAAATALSVVLFVVAVITKKPLLAWISATFSLPLSLYSLGIADLHYLSALMPLFIVRGGMYLKEGKKIHALLLFSPWLLWALVFLVRDVILHDL